ncbi:MAG: hypothetical protein ACRC0J_16770 [Shewanella oncorhynchi]
MTLTQFEPSLAPQNTSKRSVQHPLLDDIDQALAAIVSVVARNTIELS